MKIQSLSQSGIHQREIRGIKELQQSLPDDWFAYTSLEMLDRKSGNLEIDVVICAFSRIIVTEIKDWNGKLTSSQGRWQVNGDDRGKSPVITVSEKARKLASKLRIHFGKNKVCPWVESCVLLTGNSNRNDLPQDEKEHTFELEYFKKLGTRGTFDKEFPHPNYFNHPIASIKKDLDEFFLRGDFRTLTKSYNDYKPEETPFFRHPQGIYEEFYALKSGSSSYRALLRLWDFDALANIDPIYANTAARKEIALREIDAIDYLKTARPGLAGRRLFLTPLSNESRDSVSTNFFELYDLSNDTMRLHEFIGRFEKKLRQAERIDLARTLLNHVAELHDLKVAHRDLGDHSIWIERPSHVALSGFATASFPDQRTISEISGTIRAGAIALPEDSLDLCTDKFRRDVFLLGCAVHRLLLDRHPSNNGGVPEWSNTDGSDLSALFSQWFAKALDWEPEKRFRNAGEALENFKILEPKAPGQELNASDFAQFETTQTPFEKYTIEQTLTSGERQVYRSTLHQKPCLVKIWFGLRFEPGNGAANLVLLSFLRAAQALRDRQSDHLAKVIDYGLCPAGLFLVQDWHAGDTLQQLLNRTLERDERLALAESLCNLVTSIHEQGLVHGDIKPDNILVVTCDATTAEIRLLDVLDMAVNGGNRTTPAYSPPDYESATTQRCDTFAVATIVDSLLSSPAILDSAEMTVLKEALDEVFEIGQTSLSMATLPRVLRDIRSGNVKRGETIDEIVVFAGSFVESFLLSDDDGIIYLSSERHRKDPDNTLAFHITGELDRLLVSYDRNDMCCTAIKVLPRSSVEVQHSLKRAKWKSATRIRIIPSREDNFAELDDFLATYVFEESNSETSEFGDEVAQRSPGVESIDGPDLGADLEVDIGSLWVSFIEAEELILPEMDIMEPFEFNNSLGIYGVSVSTPSRSFDFEEAEDVEVLWMHVDGRPRPIGQLDVARSGMNHLILRPYYRDFVPPPPGGRLRLQSRLHKSSLERRSKAVMRIVERRSIVHQLIDCISGLRAPEERPMHADISEKLKVHYGLNDDQVAAMTCALSVLPVSLIQGPPGTGKTHVISALVHYAISSKLVQNVLLVSQSHEAVNNATDQVVRMFEREGFDPPLVRVGMKGILSDELRPYHTSALRDVYRERFRANAASRIAQIAQEWGLPADFVLECYRLRLRLGQLASRLTTPRPGGEDLTADSSEREKLQRSFEEQAQRFYAERFDNGSEAEVVMQMIEDSFCRDFSVNNPRAVSRLHQLIGLSLEWVEVLAEESNGFDQFLVKTRAIVSGTCVGVGRWNLGIESTCFDLVIIDEAARCDPGELAVSMQVGNRIVLVGDHLQLPPLHNDDLIDVIANKLGIHNR